ncbi:MAG TPA: lactate racemase domain-containing protein, partial [Negativicutes bacterium]
MKEFALDFGSGKMIVKLPEKNILDIIEGKVTKAISDVPAAVREALRHPIGSSSLEHSVSKGESVAIIAADITRLWIRQDLFLPVLLDELNAAGIPDSDILLVVALGAHR